GGGAAAGAHVGFAVPESARRLVGEVMVHGAQALSRHLAALRVAEEPLALDQVLVIGVDAPADVTRGARPLAGLDVDLFSHETGGCAALVERDERLLGLVEKDLSAREAGERSEFENPSSHLHGTAA